MYTQLLMYSRPLMYARLQGLQGFKIDSVLTNEAVKCIRSREYIRSHEYELDQAMSLSLRNVKIPSAVTVTSS